MEDFGLPKWDLLLVLIVANILVYFCIWKGVKSTGKVVYVTAIFPYFVLIIMLIRGVTLDGAAKGLRYFFVPKWADLLKPSVSCFKFLLKYRVDFFSPQLLKCLHYNHSK
jgi:SNF family Na+-dependent transporter